MKCYECEMLKSDKLKEPCCSCIRRPHDLCCSDNFRAAERKLTPCPECKKPRGEDENGAYICPCPHCGCEIPF